MKDFYVQIVANFNETRRLDVSESQQAMLCPYWFQYLFAVFG